MNNSSSTPRELCDPQQHEVLRQCLPLRQPTCQVSPAVPATAAAYLSG